jgi:hypothetical protein
MHEEPLEKTLFWAISGLGSILTLAWCFWLGGWNIEKTSLALATSCTAFAAGSLVGFIFTIFGEEVEPLGKIRDAMIALASGLAGLSIGKLSAVANVLGSIRFLRGARAAV